MKKHILNILLLLFVTFNGLAQKISIEQLNIELEKIYDEDQGIRQKSLKLQSEGKINTEEYKNLGEKQREMQITYGDRIYEIIKELGHFPGKKNFSKKAINGAWFAFQHHVVIPRWKELLPYVKKAYGSGDISGWKYAATYDRFLMMQGKRQLYGTQPIPNFLIINKIGDSKEVLKDTYMWPIEDYNNLSERRKEMGMESFDDYLKRSGRKYDDNYELSEELKPVMFEVIKQMSSI